jgi:hypothetical protein
LAQTYNTGPAEIDVNDGPVYSENPKDGQICVDTTVVDRRNLDDQRCGRQEQVKIVLFAPEKLFWCGMPDDKTNDDVNSQRNCEPEFNTPYKQGIR